MPNKDMVSIQLGSSKDVEVEVKDLNGRELSVDDIDFEIQLSPEQLMAGSQLNSNNSNHRNLKGRVRHMFNRLTGSQRAIDRVTDPITGENVVYIKDTLTVKDSVNGIEYDVEMDLKVEIENKEDAILRIPIEASENGAREGGSNIDSSDDDDGDCGEAESRCGDGVRHALAERLCRPLFSGGGTTEERKRQEESNVKKQNNGGSFNSNICAASCISIPWRRRLRRRQMRLHQSKKKDVLERSKSLELPRIKEKVVRVNSHHGKYL